MLRPGEFRELVSGRRKGALASFERGLLRVVETPYTAAVSWRNRRYDRGSAEVFRLDVPVIAVGNLSLGGTGKTPMVKWLALRLQQAGLRVSIVSRGYGATDGKHNDEALELAQALPNVPHVQNSDRVAAARRAIQEYQAQVILLDDGFQHRRLARDLDIVLLDALEPFGFDHVFPRGTLREPLIGLRRAQVVCLSRADAISHVDREEICQRVARIAPEAVWCETAHSASLLTNSHGASRPLDDLRAHRVAAFCGIGNPAGFQHTLMVANCQPVAWREFPDHYEYTAADQNQLVAMAKAENADWLVCTQKDLVKLRQANLDGLPLWAVGIEIKFLAGQDTIEAQLDRAIMQNK